MSTLNQNTTNLQTVLDTANSVRSDIATSLTNKGVTVPDGTMLDGMAALIDKLGQTKTLIEFTFVYGETANPTTEVLQAEEGMSWIDFICSEYDPFGKNLIISSLPYILVVPNYIAYQTAMGLAYISYNNSRIEYGELIQSGATYYATFTASSGGQ